MDDDILDPFNYKYDDSKRLDWLEKQNKEARYTGRCIFRWSTTGRGWRLHETSSAFGDIPTFTSVRDAIDHAMRQDKRTRTDEPMNRDYRIK